MNVNNQDVKFQIDTGSSVNIIPERYINENNEIKPSDIKLRTWTNNDYKPIGECRIVVINPKNNKKYNVKFTVCNNNLTPILGLNASKPMKLVELILVVIILPPVFEFGGKVSLVRLAPTKKF